MKKLVFYSAIEIENNLRLEELITQNVLFIYSGTILESENYSHYIVSQRPEKVEKDSSAFVRVTDT